MKAPARSTAGPVADAAKAAGSAAESAAQSVLKRADGVRSGALAKRRQGNRKRG